MTVSSTITDELGGAFCNCSNLSEVIFFGGDWLLNQEFFDCGFQPDDQGLINEEAIDEMLFDSGREFAFMVVH